MSTRVGGPRPPLTRAAIVAGALELLDQVGLDALSTRRLADHLHIKGPSLYWHLKNKAELIDHMAESLLVQSLPATDAGGTDQSWRAWLALGAHTIRRAALSRRDGARVLAAAKSTGAEPRLDRNAMLDRLMRAGFSPERGRRAFQMLHAFALGWALDEQAKAGADEMEWGDAAFDRAVATIVAGLSPDGSGH